MSLVEWVTTVITGIISTVGYPGIVFLMALESACIPIPSEIVMPFAGYLAFSSGAFDLIGLTIAGTIGNLIGSIIAYWIGMKAGRPFILRYGRYVLLRERHLKMAESWFERYGEATTFFSRVLPIIRTFISLPAGIAKMNFKKFVIFTAAGSIPWNFALAYTGYMLGSNWNSLEGIFQWLDVIVVIAVIFFIVIVVRSHLIERANNKKKEQ